jgi:hypothetical protein
MFYKLRSRPPLSLFPLKNAIHFTAALALVGWLLSSNLSSKYFSNDSLQRHLKDTFQKGLMMAAVCCIGGCCEVDGLFLRYWFRAHSKLLYLS